MELSIPLRERPFDAGSGFAARSLASRPHRENVLTVVLVVLTVVLIVYTIRAG
jgi:hypothetical protein